MMADGTQAIEPIPQETVIVDCLTPRQIEILSLFTDPLASYASVASQLCIAHQTLKNHMLDIFTRFGVNNVTAAVLIFISLYPEYKQRLDVIGQNWQLRN